MFIRAGKHYRDEAQQREAEENLVFNLHVLIGLWSPRKAGVRCRVLRFSTNRGQALLHVTASWFS